MDRPAPQLAAPQAERDRNEARNPEADHRTRRRLAERKADRNPPKETDGKENSVAAIHAVAPETRGGPEIKGWGD